ncbi:uncharacterized protein LOC108670499 [Hyalella azteca]|uniref:Uncharacterized protein LOC108670499 n=1 Tax=Hyalella azteca TaxID=294128 RepID=A0A8B7NIJ2_HYAAZ|nr:uncharacterized protein LOC108670499 [Hyalella azteca]
MVHRVIYGLRGWIAFVSFLDLGTAVQCFIDTEAYLGTLYTASGVAEHVNPAMARLLGTHRMLAAIILAHCALCIHHPPVLSLAVCSCLVTVVTHASESLWYCTTPINFYTLFPVATAVLTMIGLFVAPSFLKPPEVDDEESHLLKLGLPRKKNWNKKRT